MKPLPANNPSVEQVMATVSQSRRDFLATSASGVGGLALASLFQAEGLLAAESTLAGSSPKAGHFPAKAKSCIFIFLAGAPSQVDLFDPKPKLKEMTGQQLPDSMTKNVRFAFINKEAMLMGSDRKFARHGKSGAEISELLPHLATCADDLAIIRSMHTDAFNHHPGQLMMNTGFERFGRPTIGSWLNYGLGSESQNLPGYVVLWSGQATQGAATLWSSGFMPSNFQGVLFRNQGEPVLNAQNPPGITREIQEQSLAAINSLNRHRFQKLGDPEIASRVASYELAFRMQSAAPELTDLSQEKQSVQEAYGVHRTDAVQKSFATNCLLARRLVERGVRFVNLYMGGWDQHANLDSDLEKNCRVVDQPIAALLKDLQERGLLDSTLVVWGAEFGRTPLAQGKPGAPNVGRDHHPFAYTLWMAGGGIKGGQTIGETDDIGWNIVKDPVHINDFHATLLHLFGLDHTRLTYRFQGRDYRLTDVGGKVLKSLV